MIPTPDGVTDQVLPEVPPGSGNVVPFPGPTAAEPAALLLTPGEQNAFRELARQLAARLNDVHDVLDLPAARQHAGRETASTEPALPRAEPFPPPANLPETIAGESVDKVLVRLCHDARTPLTAILGFCDLMGPPADTHGDCDFSSGIRHAATELMSLFSDAANLAGIGGTGWRKPFSPMNINEVVQDCFVQLQPQAEKARVIMRLSLAAAAPRITADPMSVRQLLINLIALGASRAGGQIIVSTASVADEVIVRIRGNGDIDDVPPPSVVAPPWPTGLVVPFAKAFAAANHAHLQVTRWPQGGSLFELRFKAYDSSEGRADDGERMTADGPPAPMLR
jgi:signal transduction histidine kinase